MAIARHLKNIFPMCFLYFVVYQSIGVFGLFIRVSDIIVADATTAFQ